MKHNRLTALALSILPALSWGQTPALKDAFAGKFLIGAAINEAQVDGIDSLGVAIATRHFNTATPENCMKCEKIHPAEGVYDWAPADKFVDWCEARSMFIVGHCLVWHSQLAPWFPVDKQGNPVSAEVMKQRLREHIHAVVGRYKGRIQAWDVVNEAIMEDGSYRKTPFYEILGEEFIPLALQYAHEADPDAELYLNDYGMNVPGRRNTYVKILNDLKARGLRIDGIGMQAHMGIDYPDFGEFEQSLEAFAATGVPVMITEWDMGACPTITNTAAVEQHTAYEAAFNPYTNGLPDSVARVWDDRMSTVMDIFLRHSDDIKRVTAWGVTDGDSWKNDWPMKGRTDYPLLFDRQGRMKPFLRELVEPKTAVFSDFTYHVTNLPSKPAPDSPLLPGCYPDPSVVKVGKDYFMVNSSFTFFPGVPLWHSTDLRNWERLGFVLDRPEQLNLPDSIRVSGGIYAPAISYNPHNKLYYVITTLVDGGGNFYVTTDNPLAGRWSDPVWLPEVGGIDPSFLFDSDGKAYIVNNDDPDGAVRYDGHRAIRIRPFDWHSGKVCGPSQVLVDGGVNPAENPIWIEGPHLYHIGDTYFLMCAEGGTAADHREVLFSAKSPYGPFKPCPINPILTQRDQKAGRQDPVTCTGHADLFETPDGGWAAVFLGVRPYSADGHDIMGRETFILPVTWTKGQPVILAKGKTLRAGATPERESRLWTDKGLLSEAFFLRTPKRECCRVDATDGTLHLTAARNVLADRKSPAAVGRWVTENSFTLTSTLKSFTPESDTDIAGIVLLQDDDHNIVFGKSLDAAGRTCLRLVTRDGHGEHTLAERPIPADTPVGLTVEADGKGKYSFLYDGEQIGPKVSADILSTKTANNFTGTMMGLYATAKY